MRKTLTLIAAVGALLLAAAVLMWPDELASLYKDFRERVTYSHDHNREILRRQLTAVPPQDEIIQTASRYLPCPGAVVIGLIDRNKQVVLGWGTDVSGRPASGETRFETASISKAFAGLLLAQMVAEGKVALEEPVIDFANAHVPCFGECHITLRQLATHTSGLPPWPDNRGDTESPYSGDDLRGYLSHASLVGKPDSGALYSNTGFALLGDILAKQEGTTFNSLLQRKICRPLGMTHTQVGLPKEDEPYLARGHWADGRPTHPSSPTAGGGADGIRSTVNDLLKLAGAYIGVHPTDFGPAMELSTKSYKPFNEQLDSGLGWFVDTADGTIEKSGKIAGYRTNISMSLDRKCAVVVLAGSEAFPSPKLGKELLDMMVYRRDLIESDEIFNIMQNQ